MRLSLKELDIMDAACVPTGFFIFICYHIQLFYRIQKYPSTTVQGTNQLCRQTWVQYMRKDPARNANVAVNAIRNGLMASSLLATTTITLCTIIAAIITHSNGITSSNSNSGAPITPSPQLFSVFTCLLISFLCNLQTLRFSCFVSFPVCLPLSDDKSLGLSPEYVFDSFDKSYVFWSLGVRAFFFNIPMLLWLFGPVYMLLASLAMVIALHFLDTNSTTDPKKNVTRLNSIQIKLMDQENPKGEP